LISVVQIIGSGKESSAPELGFRDGDSCCMSIVIVELQVELQSMVLALSRLNLGKLISRNS
jgi:hypothetical protein